MVTSKACGLTLIELLVVVAIIAILAAIAVPNFLEAQTRSKVSRAKSDMRTTATGLEAYFVDRNRYPLDRHSGVDAYVDRLRQLTTPIAYITSIPSDPFAEKGHILKYVATRGVNPYARPITTNDFVEPLTYDYACRIKPDGSVESRVTWARISSTPDSVIWALRSVGPDLWPAWLGEAESAYDPTNGTTSSGNIYWTGPGRGEDGPLAP